MDAQQTQPHPPPQTEIAFPGVSPEDDRAERFAAVTRLRFRDPSLLRLALTHRSILAEWVAAGLPESAFQSNERLEFLGDALLGAIVADYLYRTDPAAAEGTLTAHRVALVRAETLVRWAREIELGEALYLAQGEKVTSGARDRMLAGAFEALVGAIYLDRGLAAARRFVERFLRREGAVVAEPADANPKGHLQEVLQERYRRSPVYKIVATEGPDHARVFTVEARLEDRLLGVGTGATKREAEQSAARAALAALTPSPSPNSGRGEPNSVAEDGAPGIGATGNDAGEAVVSPSPRIGRGGRGVRAKR
jgi:ribonuclease III